MKRLITETEYKQRGCYFCADKTNTKGIKYTGKREGFAKAIACPYEECPYRELDAFDSYSQFVDDQTKKYANLVSGVCFA